VYLPKYLRILLPGQGNSPPEELQPPSQTPLQLGLGSVSWALPINTPARCQIGRMAQEIAAMCPNELVNEHTPSERSQRSLSSGGSQEREEQLPGGPVA
jgi:hypothetical protein